MSVAFDVLLRKTNVPVFLLGLTYFSGMTLYAAKKAKTKTYDPVKLLEISLRYNKATSVYH